MLGFNGGEGVGARDGGEEGDGGGGIDEIGAEGLGHSAHPNGIPRVSAQTNSPALLNCTCKALLVIVGCCAIGDTGSEIK